MKNWTSFLLAILTAGAVAAQNPVIRDQFTADPSARVFGNRIYLYPSHDIPVVPGHGRPGWFCMEDYHVFSSANLSDWTDHGVIVSQTKVDWADSNSYSMWAPDCIYRNGKYYFYFPTKPKDTSFAKGFTIGVAIADKPSGPFKPEPVPIKGVHGIDPNVFIDKDGQGYLYWSEGNIYVARLKDNMLELASPPAIIDNLPAKGLKEGPYLFERNGIYYLTYPHVENKTERLEYAMGKSPMGPFTVTGVIMDESPTGCWTNHHSILPFQNQWYLFYHHNDLSPQFDKNRSVRIDSLFFSADGRIQKVNPTLRGVGVSDGYKPIQVDRYSAISENGVAVSFLDNTNKFAGWKTVFSTAGAWLKYNTVRLTKGMRQLEVRAISPLGGKLELRIDRMDGPIVATIDIPANTEWKEYPFPATGVPEGIHHLFLTAKSDTVTEIDWVRFR